MLHNVDETESGYTVWGFGSEKYYGDCFPFLRHIIRPQGVVKSRAKNEPRAAIGGNIPNPVIFQKSAVSASASLTYQ